MSGRNLSAPATSTTVNFFVGFMKKENPKEGLDGGEYLSFGNMFKKLILRQVQRKRYSSEDSTSGQWGLALRLEAKVGNSVSHVRF